MYKLIAIDMDGTLLKEDKTVSTKTKEALKTASSLGVKIVLSSGRSIQGIKHYLNELQLTGKDDYVIGLNGALICSLFMRQVTKLIVAGENGVRVIPKGYNLKYI